MYKTLEKNIYEEISSFTFYESKILSRNSEECHFCLTVQNRDCGTDEEILLDFIYDQDEFEEKAQATVREFMLNYIQSEISCYIDDNDYKGWTVKTTDIGLKLSNEKANKWFSWVANNEDSYENIKNEIIERLDFFNKQR